jgi:glycosyltransferase involved in cell wall biosynthesis
VVIWTLAGQFERAGFKFIDSVSIAAAGWGWYMGDNAARAEVAKRVERATDGRASIAIMTEAFPARSETFVYNEVKGLRSMGRAVRMESSVRPANVERAIARELDPTYLEDDSPRQKARDLVWLLLRHPIRSIEDGLARRRLSVEEEAWPLSSIAPAARRIAQSGDRHIHAHFAAGAALHAMRISRLLSVPYSITAHAYDIFQQPRNLAEKLEGAAFVAGECDYTVNHMRALVSPEHRPNVHRLATGVNGALFKRQRAYPGGGRVVAVGRHVEKKGFPVLIEAARLLQGHDLLDQIEIAGEGPLRARHAALIEDLGVSELVHLRGNVWGAAGVAAFLEAADLLVIPAVLAGDGDRDALPVISYEALAMEVPVIASDLVGLPEVVRPPWGRLVPPGDHEALAAAIGEVLDLPADERAAMGRAGREFVLEHGNPEDSVAKLDSLLSGSADELLAGGRGGEPGDA